jgi:hypothetical protein
VYFHLFVWADAYIDDDETINEDQIGDEDQSGDEDQTPIKFPSHARRPKPADKDMQWFRLLVQYYIIKILILTVYILQFYNRGWMEEKDWAWNH